MTEKKQKTKPDPFSFAAGPQERHRGPAEWSDLEKVRKTSEVVRQHGGKGISMSHKGNIVYKSPTFLSSGADAGTGFILYS